MKSNIPDNSSTLQYFDDVGVEDNAPIADKPVKNSTLQYFDDAPENQATAMKASVFSSTPVNPDQAAQQYQISKQVNLPVNIVRAKENEIKQMTELNSIDYDAIAKDFPAVATQLSDPNKVGAIRDDVDKLSYFERISKGYKTSQENTELAPLYIKQMLSDIGNEKFKLTPAEENQLAFIEQEQQGNQPLEYKNKGGLLQGVGTFAKNIPIYTAQAIPTILANLPATLGGAATGASIGATATRTPAGALAGAGIGARAGTFLGAAQLETGLAYKELKDLVDESGNPIEKTAAAGGAIATGVVNGLLELVPFEAATAPIKKAFSREGIKQIVKTSAGREYLKNIGSLALTEGATEGVQEFFNIAFGEVAKAASKGDFTVVGMKDANDTEGLLKFLSDSSQRVLQSAEAGVGAGLGLGAATSGVTYAKQAYDQKKQGQAQQEQIKETTQNVKESKTFNRSRELFKDVTEETLGQQNVYIPAEKVQTYFQDKTPQEVEEFYKQVPEAREQLQDALESGGNLILKGNNAYAAFAQDAYAPLEDFASLSPENITDEAYQDAFLQDVVSNVNYDEKVKKVRTEQDLVNKNIETQIQNLGIPYRDAKDLSTLTKAFYETNLKKYGNEQATKLLNNYFKNLQIKNEVYVDDVAEMLKKARAPQKALPKAGKPLLKFLKEQGGVRLGSNLAGELNVFGITPKTAKGLFKKDSGIGDVDNIPASEFANRFPNANAKTEGDYVDRQALLDLIAEEEKGNDISRQVNEEQSLVEDFIRQLDELGLDVNAPDEEIKKAIDEYRKGGYNQANKVEFVNPHEAAQDLVTQLKAIFPNIKAEVSNSINRNGDKSSYIKLDLPVISVGEIRLSDHLNSPTFSQFSEFNFVREYDLNLIVNLIKRRAQNVLNTVEKAEKFKIDNKDLLEKALKANGQYHRGLVKEAGFDPDNFPANDILFNKIVAGVEDKKEISQLKEIANPKTYFQSQNQTKTPAFKKWFGDSKVVDEKGEPLVVYYGTEAQFDEFKPSGNFGFEPAIYFSSKRKLAKEYAGQNGKLIETYLSIQNPLIINANKQSYNNFYTTLLSNINSAKNEGYDGLIIKNLDDSKLQKKKTVDDVYIVFNPTQIKSVENKGTFNPENANIYYQINQEYDKKFKELEYNKRLEFVFEEGKKLENEPIVQSFIEKSKVKETVYHGGMENFEQFDKKFLGSNTGANSAKQGFFFSNSLNTADDFLQFAEGKGGKKGIIKPYKINLQNPLIVDDEGRGYRKAGDYTNYIMQAKLNNNDGVVIKNTVDSPFITNDTDVFIVFNEKNILDIVNSVYTNKLKINSSNIKKINNIAPRGQFKYLQGKPIISLFQDKNKSTLLHELGHTFLEIQKELSQIPEISEEATKDWKVLEDWLDIKDGNITVESHEKFARGFEAYLREGKAPSIELRTAFARFFTWLTRIYKDVLQLNVKLNNEVREVFDRMLATQEAIDAQKNNPLFRVDDQVLELLNAKEKEDYLKISENAGLKARETLTKKALRQKEKENTKFYKQQRAIVKNEIKQAMKESSVYRALNFFKTGELYGAEEQVEAYKLSEEEAQSNYPEFYKKLKNKGIFEKDGVSLDIAAEDFGFKDGGVMLNSLSSAKPFNNELRRATDEEMLRRFGDMLYDGTIEEEAKDAMQNEARANKILYELNGVNRKVKSYVENKEAYKQKAQEIFAKKPLSVATDSNQFYITEVKAAREAGKALGKKDYEKAVAEKKKQLLNHYLYRESLQLKRELQTAYKKYAKYKKRPAQGKVVLEEEYREKIVELLANFGLAKMPEGVEFSVADLEKWKQEQAAKEIFGLVEFPEIQDFVNKPFKQLTADEFRTLNDAVENLAFIGKEQRFIEVEGKKIELKGLSDSIIEQLGNIETRKQSIGRPSKTEEAKELFDAYMATIIKAKEIAIDVDGGKFGGKFYNSFIEPLASGELKRNKMIKEATKKFLDLREQYLKSVKLNKKTHFKLINQSLDKEAAISIALNWGNEKNRKRIRDGYGWNDAQVNEIISSLTENEWRYVEEIWKFINSYQKDAYAVQKKLTGFTPRIEKAFPFSVKTSDGVTIQLQGGYYPIMYVDKTKLGAQIKEQINSPVGSNLPLYKSYTKERAEGKVDKQVNLTLLPAVKHIADVINDIALKEAAWSSNRLLNYAPLRKVLKEKIGDIPVETLQVWLEDMFGVTSSYAGIVERILDHIRVGTTISALGASIATTIIQIPGFVQAIPDIGYLNTIKGIYKFIGNANPSDINANRKKALEKSKILQSRAKTFNQAIYDVLKDMAGKGTISRNAIPFFFYPMQVAQSIPDTIVWYGAYSKGLKDFNGDDAKAVKYADYIVVKTQGSGLTQDLSAIERGSLGNVRRSKLIKLFTAFGTYFVAKFNVARRSFKDTNFKNPVNIAKFMSDMIALYLIEAIAGEIILNRIPDFDDDDEDAYAGYVFKTMMQTFASQFFLGREAVGLSKGYDGTPSGFGGLKKAYQGGEDVFEQTINAFTDEDIEMTKIIKGANKSASVIMHFPSTPIDTLVSAYEKEQEGEDVALIDYFIKPRKK